MNIYFWLGFIVLSFGIGFVMGNKIGYKEAYNFYEKDKNFNNKYLSCIICVYNDETCSICDSCKEKYQKYPSNFLYKGE